MTLMDIIVYTRNVQYMIIKVYDLHNQSIRIDYDSFKNFQCNHCFTQQIAKTIKYTNLRVYIPSRHLAGVCWH